MMMVVSSLGDSTFRTGEKDEVFATIEQEIKEISSKEISFQMFLILNFCFDE